MSPLDEPEVPAQSSGLGPESPDLGRRRFLIGGVAAATGIGGAAAVELHDGNLGAPPQTYRGSSPWTEGTADVPPGASGTGYLFFTVPEAGFIEAGVGRLIPHDDIGPGAVEAGVPFFLDRQLAGNYVAALTYHAAQEITTRYLKSPGPLVQA